MLKSSFQKRCEDFNKYQRLTEVYDNNNFATTPLRDLYHKGTLICKKGFPYYVL